MIRSSWLVAMAGFLLVAGGCAKRIATPDMTFESHQKVVLTFNSGEELEGKIAPGKRAVIRESDATLTAIISDVTEDEIKLTELVRIRGTSGVDMQIARASDARFASGDVIAERTYLRNDIVEVEEVKFDVVKAARSTTFWTYGAVVLTLLLGERS